MVSFLGLLSVLAMNDLKDIYDWDMISEAKIVRRSSERFLSFRIPMESLFFSPGLRVQKKTDGDYYSVVRCRVGASCDVDLRAPENATGEVVEIKLPSKSAEKVFLSGKTSSRRLK